MQSRTEAKRKVFLESYKMTGNISASATATNISRQIHYYWMRDENYATSFEEAHSELIERMDHIARMRAIEGTDVPVFYRGKRIGLVKQYSDDLLIFMLKAALMDKYRHHTRVQLRQTVDLSNVTLDELITASVE